MRLRPTSTAMALALMALGAPAWADMEAAKAFLNAEIGEMSVLDRAEQAEPADMNKGRTQERNEQPVPTGGFDAQDTDARGFGIFDRQHGKGDQQAGDHDKEQGCW